MNFKFDSLDYLEAEMSNSEKYIRHRSEICRFLSQIIDRYAKNTALQRLSDFELLIYHANAYYTNPVYKTEKFQNHLAFSDLMQKIHLLMYRFLHEKNPQIMKDREEKRSFFSDYNLEYSIPYFSWNIPSAFMPFLVAYISACTIKNRGILTPDIFFEKLRFYFDKAIEVSQKDTFQYISKDSASKIVSIFPEWCDVYLGRSYFTNLAILLKNFKNNKNNESLVKNGIQPITNVLISSPMIPNPIPYYTNLLLKEYMGYIQNHDSQELFPQLLPWKIDNEMDFIYNLFNNYFLLNIESKCNSIIEIFQKYRINNAKYELTIADYSTFKDEITDILDTILMLEFFVKSSLFIFFHKSNANTDIQKAVANNNLTISILNEQKHIQTFVSITDKCINNISKEIHVFLKRVKQASSSHPERYKKITLNQNYLSGFKEQIHKHIENCKRDVDTKFDSLPAPFFYHEAGLIQKNSYNAYFSKHDIYRILYCLVPQNSVFFLNSPEEFIINSLIKDGFHVPMPPSELAYLLLHFEELFDDGSTNN